MLYAGSVILLLDKLKVGKFPSFACLPIKCQQLLENIYQSFFLTDKTAEHNSILLPTLQDRSKKPIVYASHLQSFLDMGYPYTQHEIWYCICVDYIFF